MSGGTQPQSQFYAVANGSKPCFGKASNLAVKFTAAAINPVTLTNLPGVPPDFYTQSVIIDARNAEAVNQVQFGNNQFNINVAPGSCRAYTIPALQVPAVAVIFQNTTDSLFMVFANYEIEPQDYQASITDLPAAITMSDASITSTGASQQLVAANPDRLYLAVTAPFGGVLWFNPTGGIAGPGFASCYPIFPGGKYESGNRVPLNQVNVYCSPAGLVIPCTIG